MVHRSRIDLVTPPNIASLTRECAYAPVTINPISSSWQKSSSLTSTSPRSACSSSALLRMPCHCKYSTIIAFGVRDETSFSPVTVTTNTSSAPRRMGKAPAIALTACALPSHPIETRDGNCAVVSGTIRTGRPLRKRRFSTRREDSMDEGASNIMMSCAQAAWKKCDSCRSNGVFALVHTAFILYFYRIYLSDRISQGVNLCYLFTTFPAGRSEIKGAVGAWRNFFVFTDAITGFI